LVLFFVFFLCLIIMGLIALVLNSDSSAERLLLPREFTSI